jgi:hypothetical protein
VVGFLHDQVASGAVLLHGSNSRTIERFEPRDQTSYPSAITTTSDAATGDTCGAAGASTPTRSSGGRIVHTEWLPAESRSYPRDHERRR